MSSIQITLENAKNTLLNTQVLMGTASHNIANADNKAYARQKVLQVTNYPFEMYAGFMGMGARVDRIIQTRDQFVERSLIGAISKEADYNARADRLEMAGAYLLDNGEQGISKALGAFWDAWEALNTNPTGLSEKSLVEQSARNVVTTIQEAANGLSEVADNVEQASQNEVSVINTLLSDVAKYNEEIVKNEVGDVSANDLRDSRYQALTKLAESLPVTYREELDGSLTITVSDYSSDITLVSGIQAGTLTYDTTNHRVTYSDSASAPYPTPPEPNPPDPNSLSGGRLNGLLTTYRSIGTSHDLSYVLNTPNAADLTYVDRLNAFAATLITQVNTAHQVGGGSEVFDGFVIVDTFNAADIAIDTAFQVNAGQALSIAELQDQRLGALADSQFSGYLSNIQQRIGVDQQSAASLGAFQGSLRTELESQQQSVSGVSIDEEMIELLKYQQIYQAAAKVIEHTAEMLATVINMV